MTRRQVFVAVLGMCVIMYLFYHFVIGYDKRIATMAYDGQSYLVRDTNNKQETANALALLNNNIKLLINYMSTKQDPDFIFAVQRLQQRYKPDAISEGDIQKELTSYTVNKGEEIVFCMRTRDEHDHLYENNVLMYVAMHELAHIMSVSEQHTPEFHTNFQYIQKCAKELGIFQHSNKSVNYCGIVIPKF